jgi:hypothetical protein
VAPQVSGLLSGSDVAALASVLAHKQMHARLDWVLQQQRHRTQQQQQQEGQDEATGGAASNSSSSSSGGSSVLELLQLPEQEFEGCYPGYAGWQQEQRAAAAAARQQQSDGE